MIKKIKSYKDIQNGDMILLYGASDNGKIVQKRYFKIYSNPTDRGQTVYCGAYIVREDGSNIRDRWSWGDKRCTLYYHKNEEFFTAADGTFNKYYINPKIPCETVIGRLREEKRKINKKIMDCQYYMFKVEDK